MGKQHAPTPAQVAGLRAHASRRRQQTAERVRDAVRMLEDASRNVTAAAIEEITGIGFTALKRNTDAYASSVSTARSYGPNWSERGRVESAHTVQARGPHQISPALTRSCTVPSSG